MPLATRSSTAAVKSAGSGGEQLARDVVYCGQTVRVQVPQYFYSVGEDEYREFVQSTLNRRQMSPRGARHVTSSKVVDGPALDQLRSCGGMEQDRRESRGIGRDNGGSTGMGTVTPDSAAGMRSRRRGLENLVLSVSEEDEDEDEEEGYWSLRNGTPTTTASATDDAGMNGRRRSADKMKNGGSWSSRDGTSSGAEMLLPHTVVLRKNAGGTFGFVLCGAKSLAAADTVDLGLTPYEPSPSYPALQYLESVDENGVAAVAGLAAGDFILEINGVDVTAASHAHTVRLIRHAGDAICLKVVSPHHRPCRHQQTRSASSAASSAAASASHCSCSVASAAASHSNVNNAPRCMQQNSVGVASSRSPHTAQLSRRAGHAQQPETHQLSRLPDNWTRSMPDLSNAKQAKEGTEGRSNVSDKARKVEKPAARKPESSSTSKLMSIRDRVLFQLTNKLRPSTVICPPSCQGQTDVVDAASLKQTGTSKLERSGNGKAAEQKNQIADARLEMESMERPMAVCSPSGQEQVNVASPKSNHTGNSKLESSANNSTGKSMEIPPKSPRGDGKWQLWRSQEIPTHHVHHQHPTQSTRLGVKPGLAESHEMEAHLVHGGLRRKKPPPSPQDSLIQKQESSTTKTGPKSGSSDPGIIRSPDFCPRLPHGGVKFSETALGKHPKRKAPAPPPPTTKDTMDVKTQAQDEEICDVREVLPKSPHPVRARRIDPSVQLNGSRRPAPEIPKIPTTQQSGSSANGNTTNANLEMAAAHQEVGKVSPEKSQTGNVIIAGNAVNFLVMAEMARQDYLRKKGVNLKNDSLVRKGKYECSEPGRFGNSNKDTISEATTPHSEKTTGTRCQTGERTDVAPRNNLPQNGQHLTEATVNNKNYVGDLRETELQKISKPTKADILANSSRSVFPVVESHHVGNGETEKKINDEGARKGNAKIVRGKNVAVVRHRAVNKTTNCESGGQDSGKSKMAVQTTNINGTSEKPKDEQNTFPRLSPPPGFGD